MKKCNIFLFTIIFNFFIIGSVSAASVLLSDQGTDVKQSGATLSSGNLTVLIYPASNGETPIFNQTFTGAIINGSWNVMINPDLEFGRRYWKDYAINEINLNFSGQDRLEFTSPVGYINNASLVNFSLIQNCSSGQAIRQVYANGSVVCESIEANVTDTQWNIAGSNYMMNASGVLSVNETKLNNTIDARVLLNIPYQSSGAGWMNNSIQTNTSLNVNILNGRNITTTGTGFFGFLGSLTSRITRLFVQDIDVSGNVNASGNVTAALFIGDGSLLTGISSGVSYTHLSNFTDDLGNRGYTSLSNFTNDKDFINATQAQVFNDTAAIASKLDAMDQRYNETSLINNKLDATDQRYNETAYINTNFYAKSQVYNKTEIDAFGFVNSSGLQSYNETSLIASVNQTLSANKLDVADQKYNDTAKINAVNTTANIDSLGFLSKSGMNANQNINVSPYNITASFFAGDGSRLTGIVASGDGTGGWTNTSAITSTVLNVNVSGNVTANKFIGDGSLLTGISGSADGTGGWTNTSAITSTVLNVNVSGNVTANKFIGDGSLLTNLPSGSADGTSGWTNDSIQTNTSLNVNVLNGRNITTTGTGFFGFLGSAASRITKLFVQDIDASGNVIAIGNVTAAKFIGDGSLLTGISSGAADGTGGWTNTSTTTSTNLNVNVTGNITASKFIGDGSLLTNIPSAVNYTHLSNFTDNLGNRGFTSLSNFTNNLDFINSTKAQAFNDTALINAINTSANVDSLGFLNKSGTNANQNINVSPYNITASHFIGDGSQLTGISSGAADGTGGWTNTSTTTSTNLNVNISGNVTASKFIGDGSLLTGIAGSGITSLNGQTGPTQTFAVGTAGSDFGISSANNVHTFNIPDASSSARGLVTTGTQAFAGNKHFSGAVTIGDSATETSNALFGIKTTSRSALADVGNKSNYLFELAYDANTNGNGVGMVFRSSTDSGNVGAAIIHERTGSNSQGKLHFYTKQSTTVEVDPIAALTIDQTGKIGIGTQSPNQALHVVGNANVTGDVTANKFIGDGSLLTNLPSGTADSTGGWTNTSTITSTGLNVNVSGNVTANKFIGDGSLLTGISSGSADGTGGWINTSTTTSTSLNVNVTGNVTASKFIGDGSLLTGISSGAADGTGGWINTSVQTSTNLNLVVNNSVLFVNATSGRIGIGTPSPNQALHVVGSANVTGNVTASKFFGDGSQLTGIIAPGDGTGGWANTSTITSTGLNVNVSGNVTASKFIGDGSLLTGISGSADGTGGWTNTSAITSTALNVNVSGNVTASKFIGDGSLLTGIVASGDGTGGWTNDSIQTNTSFNVNVLNGRNITTTGTGFFGFLGSAVSRLTKLFVQDIDASGNVIAIGNVTAAKFIGDGSLLTNLPSGSADGTGGWTNTSTTTSTGLNVNVTGNITASKFIGDGSQLTGITASGDGTGGWTNTSSITATSLNVNVTGNVTASKFIGDGSLLTNLPSGAADGTGGWINTSVQTSTNLNLVVNNSVLFVNATSGRIGIGTPSPNQALHVVGNANVSGNVTASKFIGDGSLLTGIIASGDGTGSWSNTSTTTSTNLNVNVSGNVTASKFIGDGSLLTGISGSADGTGGWANTSTITSTGLNVNLTTGNLTVMNGRVGIGTASPSQALHVVGQINATNNISTSGLCLNGDCRNAWPGAGSDTIWNIAGSNYLINISGVLSVNETKLNATIDARAVAGSSPGGSNGQIQFNNNGNFGADGDLTWDNTNKRLGIGTANPQEGFQINNRIPAVRFSSGYGSSSVSNVAYWGLQDDSNNNGVTKGFVWRIDKPTSAGSSADLTLRLVQGFSSTCSGYPFCNLSSINGVGTDAVTFAGNGNVGIGTSTPGEKLQVNGNISVNRGSTIGPKSAHANTGTTSTQIGSITAGALTGMEVVTTWDGSTNDEEIVFRTHNGGVSAGERFRIDKDGKLTGAGNDLIIMRSYGWASGDFGNDLDTGISATTYPAVNLASWDAANADDWTRFDVGADGDWHLMSYGGRAQITFYHKSMATRDLSG